MEQLFSKVRDMALAQDMTATGADRLRHLLDGLRQPLSTTSDGSTQDVCAAHKQASGRRQRGKQQPAEDADSEQLQQELQSAKRLLQKRIVKRTWKQ